MYSVQLRPLRGSKSRAGPDFQLLHSLPTELLELTLEYLDVGDLLRLRRVDRALNQTLAEARNFQNVSLCYLPRAQQHTLLERLPALLPGTRHLVLRSFPASTLSALLPACSHRLTTLDLSFSSVSDQDLVLLAGSHAPRRAGSPSPECSRLVNLRSLKLKGCRRISDFLTRILSDIDDGADSPREGQPSLSRLTSLDLSWSSVATLPIPLATHLPALASLSISTTPYLPRPILVGAISSLPNPMTELDLSHLTLTAKDLSKLAFLPPPPLPSLLPRAPENLQRIPVGSPNPRPLRLVLAGNDHLTVSSLSLLERHWSATLPALKRPVGIEHGGLMLESDEEEDVRRFVEMVAGVIMRDGRSSADREIVVESS
ncbi:hypothetical protein JCM3774_004537 [Rhodotorula dairenensis]